MYNKKGLSLKNGVLLLFIFFLAGLVFCSTSKAQTAIATALTAPIPIVPSVVPVIPPLPVPTIIPAITTPTVTTSIIPATTIPSIPTTSNWTALPPYNTLWPLWSPTLSPADPTTGLPTPIVSSLTSSTVLPVQPGLTWNPSIAHPWLLYNTPVGMVYYDPINGINPWPPTSLINQITGQPISLALPAGYETLPPTPAWWLLQEVPAANWEYLSFYPGYAPVQSGALVLPTIDSLLTASALLL